MEIVASSMHPDERDVNLPARTTPRHSAVLRVAGRTVLKLRSAGHGGRDSRNRNGKNKNARDLRGSTMLMWRSHGGRDRRGGEGEIRTHDPFLADGGFQDRCLKPLGHLSAA
jgi:hypothetical protein